jgi:hypothetical protein
MPEGFNILEESNLKCADCNTNLLSVILTETNDTRKSKKLQELNARYKVSKCCYCGGSSFLSKIYSGTSVVSASKDNIILDVEDTYFDDDNNIVTIITTRKKS